VKIGFSEMVQGVARRADAVDDDAPESVLDRGLEAPLAPVVDIDQVGQSPEDASQAGEALYARASTRLVQGRLQGLGTGLECMRAIKGLTSAFLALLLSRGGGPLGTFEPLMVGSQLRVERLGALEARAQLAEALLVLGTHPVEAGKALGKARHGLARRRQPGEGGVVLLASPAGLERGLAVTEQRRRPVRAGLTRKRPEGGDIEGSLVAPQLLF
jgi:hypothetical protein